jgi:hypothetical protein
MHALARQSSHLTYSLGSLSAEVEHESDRNLLMTLTARCTYALTLCRTCQQNVKAILEFPFYLRLPSRREKRKGTTALLAATLLNASFASWSPLNDANELAGEMPQTRSPRALNS